MPTPAEIARQGSTSAKPGKVTFGKLPSGYAVRWPHTTYDLLLKINSKVAGPKWHVTCNVHQATHPAGFASGTKADQAGSAKGRATWCPSCKSGK